MRAAVCRRFGDPSVLEIAEVPPPPLGPGCVRVAVKAAGVNFADSLLVAGTYQVKPPLPFSPGLEVAGTVTEAGPDAAGLGVGDRVLALLDHGGFAEQAVARAADVFPIPDNLDFAAAAGFAVAYGTSHLGLTAKARLKAGETLLVHGAAGGVGLTAVEVGRLLGATVIATAGGPDKLKVAAAAGAAHLIDYWREDIRERVKEITGGRGADVVYDPVGGAAFDASLRCTAPGGRIVVVGFASGKVPQIPANILLVKNIAVIGYYWGAHRDFAPAAFRASMEELLAWQAAGRLKPHVSRVLPLEKAGEAVALLTGRRSTGKVVLKVAD
jgi:NADPH2:quinone reductase